MDQNNFYDTVITYFNKKGVKFTLDEIADKLRISKRTIYEQYGNKEQVMFQAVKHFFGTIKAQEKIVLDDNSLSLMDKIRKVITMYPPLSINYPYVEGMRRNYPNVYREILHQFEQNWENTFNLFNQAFVEEKIRRFDLETLKIILTGIFQEVVEYDEPVQKNMIIRCLDFLLEGYRIDDRQ